MNPLQLPTTMSALGPEEISNCFRAHLERSVFRDLYSTPAQIAIADALTVDERRAMETLINEACGLFSQKESYAERETVLQQRAAWLSTEDRHRLLSAAAYMMR